MSVKPQHCCPASSRTVIVISLAGTRLEMVRCSACHGQWWERDGASVPLPELLPLLKNARNAPRVPRPRRARTVTAAPARAVVSPRRTVDLTDGAEESSLLFRQLLAFQEAAAREQR